MTMLTTMLMTKKQQSEATAKNRAQRSVFTRGVERNLSETERL